MPDLFAKLPFTEAIEALLDRLAITKEEFLALDAAARSRAFTMARVSDQHVLESIHDELVQAAEAGETFRDFKGRLADLRERTGWTGTNDWHYRLVYEQNLAMASTAGQYQQGMASGLSVVRILPSLSDEKRADHAALAGELFRVGPGSMLPPWDFNCLCGWEWVFNDELEAMGKTADDFEMLPDMTSSEFTWSTSAYLASRRGAQLRIENGEWRIEKDIPRGPNSQFSTLNSQSQSGSQMSDGRFQKRERTMIGTGERVVVCEAIAAPKTTAEVMLVPWGRVERKDGNSFTLDDDGARRVIAAYRRGGTDLVIDYEHQSIGGRFSSPDGTAPAAGWVKDLQVRPGQGIYGRVEWTERARLMLARKEYRYLSPVVVCDEADRVIELLNCALTNEPMIAGFPALVNKDGKLRIENGELRTARSTGSSNPQPSTLNSQFPKVNALINGGAPMDLATQLRDLLKLGQDASPEEIFAKIKEMAQQISSGETGPVEGGAVIEALADLATGDLSAAGGEQIASSLKARDYAKAGAGLKIAVNRLRHPPDMVGKDQYEALAAEVNGLKTALAERELNELISVNSNKLAPSEMDGFRELYGKDPEFAHKWLTAQPMKVNTRATGGAAGGTMPANERMTLINTTRATLAEDAAKGRVVIGEERNILNGTLVANGMAKLTDEEAGKLGIAVAA